MEWVKIMCSILDNRKIKMIHSGPEGNSLFLLWLLMLTEAGKCNRGGYLMIADNLPYTEETLNILTGISLATVRLGLLAFAELGMIDREDGAIFIKNWRKYQSEDKLKARREKDRLRQQKYREKEREKMKALPPPDQVSRDSHVSLSRDVTQENRQEQSRVDKETNFHLCARMIIVCCGILLPNFGDYCHVFAGKGLGELDPMQLLVSV